MTRKRLPLTDVQVINRAGNALGATIAALGLWWWLRSRWAE